jgi:tetratricopeptide (TPR) repeat protein
MRLLLTLFFILLPWVSETNGAAAFDTFDRDILRGIELLYNGETDTAEDLFRNVLERKPEDPAGHFYMAMVTWSRLTIGFWSREMVQQYIERIDRTISAAKAAIEDGNSDAYTYFFLGGALGFKGRFYLMERKWLSSFSLASDAVDALRKCSSMDPSNKDVLLGLGIFDYYTAKLSGVMRFFTFLLVHKGDREEGLRKLHQAAQEAAYSSTEAKSVLLHIYLYLEDDRQKALLLGKELAARYSGSRLYKYLEGVAHIRLNMDEGYKEVAAEMRAAVEKAGSGKKGGLWIRQSLYLDATYSLSRGNYEEARRKLDEILTMQDPVNDPLMIAYPLLKKGVSYDLEGAREKALDFYSRVMNMENGAGAQFLAEKFIKKPAQKNDPFIGY